MGKRQVNTTLQGALVLSIAAFIAKLLSAVYRVPFQNMVGNTGFYVYQQVYPLYGIGMTFALSGLPVFISKMIAEAHDLPSQQQVARQVYRWLWGLALVIFIGLMLGAPILARGMGDRQLTPLIQVVAWMFLFMPALSVSRGYYQGRFQMLPTARSQVIEQLVRVIVILVAAGWATQHDWSVYRMGAWALSSGAIAAVAALLVIPRWRQRGTTTATRVPHVGRRLLVEGGTLCLLTAMLVLLQLVDSFTVKNGLVAGGMGDVAAKSLKGVYDRAQPLVQLGLVVAVAFATSLLPALTAAQQEQRPEAFKRLTTTMMRIALMVAAAATAGLVALMPWVNRLLFGDAQGSGMLSVYMLSIILATLIQTYNSVLQSQDQYRLTVVALTTGLLVKIGLNHWAVRSFGATGASWLTVVSLGTIFLVIWYGSDVTLRSGVWTSAYIRILLACTILMVFGVRLMAGLLTYWWPALLTSRLAIGGGLLVVIPLGGLLFLGMALKWQLLSVREWLAIPHGESVLRLWQQLSQHGGK
ncbi:polysaccharide biosynthesis protein [Levilactobacillus tujiorum]|uniref:Polysaccharide biosynthesis protein n=1 Tax=Levilactobacillus tujiorum TaxID=2912243 RepID=A0ABX1L855_9LACO|nr:polysaccharide biosynthesis protein [Levilactobacillus tujiorum]MCH5465559.1 polysaccharide biosynthesis protein [Levilactobacillus tujiorum]NLR12697.1 polysaccharide biosynthesis protein [Lactobacillus sp. HBUAS51387]NLR30554.1 polysaccharide biosynthesis protein [Levilactobacillus tujiorum]